MRAPAGGWHGIQPPLAGVVPGQRPSHELRSLLPQGLLSRGPMLCCVCCTTLLYAPSAALFCCFWYGGSFVLVSFPRPAPWETCVGAIGFHYKKMVNCFMLAGC